MLKVAIDQLICPACCGALVSGENDNISCKNCGSYYPVIDDIPVLIDEQKSLFKLASFVNREDTFFVKSPGLRDRIYAMLPSLSRNFWAEEQFAKLRTLIFSNSQRPRVLVIGGSILGDGMGKLRADASIEFVDSDVAHGELTQIICDGHDLPFKDEQFDAVIAQAVLEHVADPGRVVAEIHRVLKPGGHIYADTPFLQATHSAPYDFHRFTHIGYRRLFAHFDRVVLQAAGGPGHVLAHAWENFLVSVSSNRNIRGALIIFARLSAFWCKYLDLLLNKNDYALHSAYGLIFIGRKRTSRLSLNEIMADASQL